MPLGFLHRGQRESWNFAGGKAQIVDIEVGQAEPAKVVKLVGIELDAIVSVTVAVQGKQKSNKVGDIVSWCSFGDPHDAVGRQNTWRVSVGSQNTWKVSVGTQGDLTKFKLNALAREVVEKPVLIGGVCSTPGGVAEPLHSRIKKSDFAL